MKYLKILIYFFIIFTFMSCLSTPNQTPQKNNMQNGMIYMYRNPSTEYIEYEIISLSIGSEFAIYSISRGNALIDMQLGTYAIYDGVINIFTGKFNATGLYSTEKIIIDEKEFIRS